MELLCLSSKYRFNNITYEHVKQNTYIQNLFPVTITNLTHLDIFFAEF